MSEWRLGWGGRSLFAALFGCALLLSIAAASAAGRDFDNPASHVTSQQFGLTSVQRQDTPTDSGYDNAEADDEDGLPTSTNLYDERFDLFGFPSESGYFGSGATMANTVALAVARHSVAE